MSKDKDKDKLLGDLTADALRKMRLDRVARRISKVTKKDCKCEQRKQGLNNLHERFKNGRKKDS